MLAANEVEAVFNSIFTFVVNVTKIDSDYDRFVPTAKRTNFNKFEDFTISFMYNKNKNGPNVEPWVTPNLKLTTL